MRYVSITFDDGRKDNYLYAYPIMKKYGLTGTIYCTTGFIDGSWDTPNDWHSCGEAISKEQLCELKENGWEIALHGDKHTTEFFDLSVAAEKMLSWGVGKLPMGFSMPNSNIEKDKLKEVIDKCQGDLISYIRTGRRINTRKLSSKVLFGLSKFVNSQKAYNCFNNKNLNDIRGFNPNSIYSIVIRCEDDPKMIMRYIEQMPDNSWCVLMFHSIWPQNHELHGIDPWNWSLEKFRYFCAGLKSLKNTSFLDVKNVNDIVKLYKGNLCSSQMENRKIKNKVIVWSIDDFNTLGLMRELGQFDINLEFIIKGNAGFASKSKYCKRFVETETIEDGMQYIINNYKNEEFKPIVIISSDEIVTYVDLHREEIENYCILPITKEKGNIAKYIDKNNMTELAKSIGILCPESSYVKWNSNIEAIDYPCIIKPSHQTEGHYNEFKFKICKNEKELRQLLKFVRHESEFILQEYIPKELDILVYGARMRNGDTVIAGAMIRDRWADSGSSSHGYLTNEIPKCVDVEKIQKLVEQIDYYGPFSCEYGMVNDKAYFFEINLRNDGTSHYFFQSGANIPLAYVYSCADADYAEVNTNVSGKCYFIDELFDFENVIKRNITRKQWKRDFEKATVYKYYDPIDKEPWEIVNRMKYKQIVQDFVLKKYRLYIVAVLDRIGFRK